MERDVVAGERGFLNHTKHGQIIVDTSTITYAATLDIAKIANTRGARFMDAPVSGMEARAVEGTLTVERPIFELVKPYLECMGSKILFMGGIGAGQLTKLINQLLFDINAVALAEILPMAAKMGLDPAMVGEVVNSGTGSNYASEFFIPRILKNDFLAGYPM